MGIADLATAIDHGGLIKICGLREPEHAAAAAAAGANLLGFIFAPARRQVTAEMARSCIEAARDRANGHTFHAVGVFVDAQPAEITRTVREAELDAVQLSGSEPPTLLRDIVTPAIKSLRPGPNAGAMDVLSEIASYDNGEKSPIGYQIDGYVEGLAGGTGHRADWNIAAMVNRDRPIILAGGLDPNNVTAAIRIVNPRGVDVSSGVEVDGKKDIELIEAFIRAARLAFQEMRSEPH